MNRYALALLLVLAQGCACRSKGATPYNPGNLWNRNQVVSVPTFAGNCAGFAMAAPVGFMAAWMIWPLAPAHTTIALVGPSYVLSHVGGGVLGAPFIPLSLFVAEDPDYCWGG